ncbi:hypothetical protein C8N43_3416 [Litoreibacter ponti]|uniref:Cytochrome c domain-containing protein n=1 Tax=Litoreibacter ponti TaxID=1510457 RepID=A0A2T6BEX7_9RHOB|nr:hypothetical protein [Litoreibacter ponti]PTX54599.1 hypothetical protein C8N43_3416 [Litoreibacter ponti]
MRWLMILCLLCGPAFGQDAAFRLAAPAELQETGFLKHLLPRFSLKTQLRIAVVEGDAEAQFARSGDVPVFQGPDGIWYLSHDGSKATARFEDWLTSEIGLRTVVAFQPDGAPLFSEPSEVEVEVAAASFDGDLAEGEKLALTHCGRCHVVNESNRMNAIGSSPSFAVLRTLSGWDDRILAFFTLKPHPAFTQVEDVTEPFDPLRPSPIAPIEVTLDDIDAILAYTASLAPADLGAPVKSQ